MDTSDISTMKTTTPIISTAPANFGCRGRSGRRWSVTLQRSFRVCGDAKRLTAPMDAEIRHAPITRSYRTLRSLWDKRNHIPTNVMRAAVDTKLAAARDNCDQNVNLIVHMGLDCATGIESYQVGVKITTVRQTPHRTGPALRFDRTEIDYQRGQITLAVNF
jgi:hypothetical protein